MRGVGRWRVGWVGRGRELGEEIAIIRQLRREG